MRNEQPRVDFEVNIEHESDLSYLARAKARLFRTPDGDISCLQPNLCGSGDTAEDAVEDLEAKVANWALAADVRYRLYRDAEPIQPSELRGTGSGGGTNSRLFGTGGGGGTDS